MFSTAANYMGDGRALWVKSDESLIYFGSGPGVNLNTTTLNKWTPTGGVSVVSTSFLDIGNILGDETPVCTRQMCSVRDRWDDYVATGAEVVGISSDSIESHRKFAEHHNLPLRLLSDSEGVAAKLYGAQSIIPGRVARSVFVIDAGGIVRHRDVRPLGLFKPKDDATMAAIRAAQKEG
jgi:peroxiredoxin Q/BCP